MEDLPRQMMSGEKKKMESTVELRPDLIKKEDQNKTDQGQHDLSQQLVAEGGAEIDSVFGPREMPVEKKKMESAESHLDQGQGVNSHLCQQMITKDEEIYSLKRELEKVRDQNADLKSDVQGLTTAVSKKEDKIIALEEKIGGIEAERQKLENDLKEMKGDLEKKNVERDETKKKLEGYFKQVTDLQSQLEENNRASSTRASNLSKLTEESEVWKLQASVYHEDFDKERFEREQESGQQAELHRENQSLREQLDNERLQRGRENQRLGELERENISLRAQLENATMEIQEQQVVLNVVLENATVEIQEQQEVLNVVLENATMQIQGQQVVLNVVQRRLDLEARRFRRAVHNPRVAQGRIQMRRAMAGPAVGPVAGPVAGPIAGPLVGPIAGPLAGPIPGPLAAPIPGLVAGLVFIQTVPDSLDQ